MSEGRNLCLLSGRHASAGAAAHRFKVHDRGEVYEQGKVSDMVCREKEPSQKHDKEEWRSLFFTPKDKKQRPFILACVCFPPFLPSLFPTSVSCRTWLTRAPLLRLVALRAGCAARLTWRPRALCFWHPANR